MSSTPLGPDDARNSGSFAGDTYTGDTYTGDASTGTGDATYVSDAYATDQVGGSHAVGATAAMTSTGSGEERSVGEIFGDTIKDLTTLMRAELELAKTEAKTEAKKAGKGAGLLAGAGVFGHVMLIALTAFLISLLHYWMDWPWAALIVTVLWGIVAAVLAMRGKKELQNANPALPTTQQTLKEDVQWAKDQKSS